MHKQCFYFFIIIITCVITWSARNESCLNESVCGQPTEGLEGFCPFFFFLYFAMDQAPRLSRPKNFQMFILEITTAVGRITSSSDRMHWREPEAGRQYFRRLKSVLKKHGQILIDSCYAPMEAVVGVTSVDEFFGIKRLSGRNLPVIAVNSTIGVQDIRPRKNPR